MKMSALEKILSPEFQRQRRIEDSTSMLEAMRNEGSCIVTKKPEQMVKASDLSRLLESILELSIKGKTDEGTLFKFLGTFEPVLLDILRENKFLKMDFDEDSVIYIFDSQKEINEYLVRLNQEEFKYDSEQIVEQISFEKFIELSNGEYMNFSLYNIEDDGSLSFNFQNNKN